MLYAWGPFEAQFTFCFIDASLGHSAECQSVVCKLNFTVGCLGDQQGLTGKILSIKVHVNLSRLMRMPNQNMHFTCVKVECAGCKTNLHNS